MSMLSHVIPSASHAMTQSLLTKAVAYEIVSRRCYHSNFLKRSRGGLKHKQCRPFSAPPAPTLLEHQHSSTTTKSAIYPRPFHPHNPRLATKPTSVFVPPRHYESDLVVVLDMDECMVHSQFLSHPAAAELYTHQLMQKRQQSSNAAVAPSTNEESTPVDSFRIHLPDGELVHVNIRPGLPEFLEKICNKHETHVFTAAVPAYADPLLDKLDPTRTLFAGRWYRDSCRYHPQHHAYIKDLENLPLPQPLDRVVLVDNNPLSFLSHPNNGILVRSFYNDGKDDTLKNVWQLVESLDKEHDVRPRLKQMFGLEEAFSEQQNQMDF